MDPTVQQYDRVDAAAGVVQIRLCNQTGDGDSPVSVRGSRQTVRPQPLDHLAFRLRLEPADDGVLVPPTYPWADVDPFETCLEAWQDERSIAVVVVPLVTLLPKIAAHTPELLGLAPAQAEFGESVSLHGSSKRPSLEIAATGPVSLRAKAARRPLHRGQRLVAVRVDVRSVSSQEWTSPKLAVRATDSRGHTLTPRAIDQIARGARLPRSLHLGAGGHVAGYVAFAVGSKAKIEDFALTLGPSSYETVHWKRAR